jgi:hypothetical protein
MASVAYLSHDDERGFAEALEHVGRGAWLVSASTKELCASSGDLLGDGEGLFAGLDGARAGDDGEVASTDRGVGAGEGDDGVLFLHIPANELIRFRDANDFGDAGEFFEIALIDLALIAGNANRRALRTGHGMWAKAQLFNVFANSLDLLRRCLGLHDD